MGISSKYNGYKYLKDSIRMFYFYPESSITKEIYNTLAIKYRVSKSCIERSINRAIVEGFNRNDYDYIEKIFGSSISMSRGIPTNVELIETIVERLNIIK
jgi:two-component system response regulator (stage 0 sporulation protein A)